MFWFLGFVVALIVLFGFKGFLKISKPLKKNIVCRQDAPKVYEHVASMYAISPKYILKNHNLFYILSY